MSRGTRFKWRLLVEVLSRDNTCTALTYPFGEPCSSIAGSRCSFELVQLYPARASILCKPLHGLGGDGVMILNAIVYSINYQKQQQCA